MSFDGFCSCSNLDSLLCDSGLNLEERQFTPIHRLVKNLYCIETGGTFSSVPSDAGYLPGYNLAQLLHDHLEYDPNSPIRFCFPAPGTPRHFGKLLDSTNIQLSDQIRLANMVEEVLQMDTHQGIVITHGTDTMEYTASMLALLIPNPSKRIVLTGSMRSFTEHNSDAKKNFQDAALVAASDDVPPGVYVVFNGRIIPASWVTKIGLDDIDAFRSIHAEIDLGKVVNGMIKFFCQLERTSNEPIDAVVQRDNALPLTEVLIDPILIEPGLKPEQLDSFISTSIGHGLIIRGYGSGSIPDALLPVLKKHASDRPILVDTQVPLRGANGAKYEVETSVVRAGLMTAHGLSPAVALNAFRMVLAEHIGDLELIKTRWQEVCDQWGGKPKPFRGDGHMN